MSRKTLTMPASTIRFSSAIRYKKPADSSVPALPPAVWTAELGSTTVPNTALAAMVMPAPTAITTVAWPKEKKNPLPSGRLPSAISLRGGAGKERPPAPRPLAGGHQLSGGVVDARDVVGVEGVPEPEEPRGDRDA